MSAHVHCDNCFQLNCKHDLCKLIDCNQQGCEFKMHECKLQDHLSICLRVRAPCINSEFGCNLLLLRFDRRNHLEGCPASVVNCSFEYNRQPEHKESLSKFSDQFKRKSIDDTHLDSSLNIALAYRDQDMINGLYKLKIGCVLRNNLIREYPGTSYFNSALGADSIEGAAKDTIARSRSLALGNSSEISTLQPASIVANADDGSDSPPGLSKSICEQLMDYNDYQSNAKKDNDSTLFLGERTTSSLNNEANVNGQSQCEDKKLKENQSENLFLDLNFQCIPHHIKKPSQMYTFQCGGDFRRDEYSAHYQNVHSDIMGSLSLMEKFCPLQQIGCPFIIRRLHPVFNGEKTNIVFSQQNKTFGHLVDKRFSENDSEEIAMDEQINLTDLPIELISHIISYLDAFSLNNLSLVNKMLRSVCCDQLKRNGLVSLIWKKDGQLSNEREASWTVVGYQWKFSNHFSLIKKWEFADQDKLLNHISNCGHFDRLIRSEPYKVIGLGNKS